MIDFLMSFLFDHPLRDFILISSVRYSTVSSKQGGNFLRFYHLEINISPRIVIDVVLHFRAITVEQFTFFLVWFRPSKNLI